MAKKIQISTIREMANVQVIRINASFVANAVKKQIKLKEAIGNVHYLISNTDLEDAFNEEDEKDEEDEK